MLERITRKHVVGEISFELARTTGPYAVDWDEYIFRCHWPIESWTPHCESDCWRYAGPCECPTMPVVENGCPEKVELVINWDKPSKRFEEIPVELFEMLCETAGYEGEGTVDDDLWERIGWQLEVELVDMMTRGRMRELWHDIDRDGALFAGVAR